MLFLRCTKAVSVIPLEAEPSSRAGTAAGTGVRALGTGTATAHREPHTCEGKCQGLDKGIKGRCLFCKDSIMHSLRKH